MTDYKSTTIFILQDAIGQMHAHRATIFNKAGPASLPTDKQLKHFFCCCFFAIKFPGLEQQQRKTRRSQ